MWKQVGLALVPSLGLFSSVGFVQFVVFLFYITFYYILLLSLEVCFLLRDRKGAHLNGRGSGKELKGVQGGKSVRIHYV